MLPIYPQTIKPLHSTTTVPTSPSEYLPNLRLTFQCIPLERDFHPLLSFYPKVLCPPPPGSLRLAVFRSPPKGGSVHYVEAGFITPPSSSALRACGASPLRGDVSKFIFTTHIPRNLHHTLHHNIHRLLLNLVLSPETCHYRPILPTN